VLGDSENTDIPEWEPIIVVQKINQKWVCTKRYSGLTETYTMLPEGNREDYNCVYGSK